MLGQFSVAQDVMDNTVRGALRRRAGPLGEAVAKQLLERLTDKDRVRLFKAALQGQVGQDVPVDRMVTAFNEGKQVRDSLAHSQRYALTEDRRESVVEAGRRLEWLAYWCVWLQVDMGLTTVAKRVRDGFSSVAFPRPPLHPAEEAMAAYRRRMTNLPTDA